MGLLCAMGKKKPVVGQIVYSLNIGNAARRRPQELTEFIVKKVGRVYFTAGLKDRDWGNHQYYIDGWKEKYDSCANSELFETPEAYEAEKKRDLQAAKIRKTFQFGAGKQLSNDQIDQAFQILFPEGVES